MNRRLSSLAAISISAWLPLQANHCFACQGGSSSITNLPAIASSGYQVFGMNPSGQLTGFFYVLNQHPAQAFIYTAGQLTNLGTLGGSTSEGHWINQSGQIVGRSDLTGDSQSHAFFFGGNGLQDLGTLGGASSSATAINDSGVIIGTSDLLGNLGTASFVVTNGVMADLGNFGSNYSSAFALNNSGLVVGEAGTASADLHAFSWSNGILSDLGTLGGSYSSAFAVNDAGIVVGESAVDAANIHAFAVFSGVMTDLGAFGGTYSTAYLVNSNGMIAGVANTTDDAETHGFVYLNGVMTDIGTLGGFFSLPNGINNDGQVVGESLTAGGDYRAFLWHEGKLIDLNSLLPTNSGWELTSALYINDAGRIVGVGNHNGLSEWFILDSANGNNPPTAVAGPGQMVECQSQVTLDGSGSSDPDNDALTFEWSSSGNVLGNTAVLTISLPVGTNVLTLKVTDTCGASAQANTTIIVGDTTPPTGSCPGSLSVSADASCQAAVPDFKAQVVASDNCSSAQSLVITQEPAAGTLLGLGQHPVSITVADAAGNKSTCTAMFIVVDTTAPTILSVPAAFTLSAGAGCQAQVPNILSNVAASDSCTPANLLIKSQSPAVGTLVDAGSHSILVTVTDASGNSSTATVPFSVVDRTAPTFLSGLNPIKLSADANCQAAVPNLLGSVAVVDNCTPANQIVLVQSPSPGTVLVSGVYSVTIKATDAAGNSSSVATSLEIADTTGPVIQSLLATPNVLSPPNHQMVSVTVTAHVIDNCDCAPVTKIVSVTCSEPPALGDIQITGALTVSLAASKPSSGNARVYTINVRSTDASGNSSMSSVVVTVPKTGNGGTAYSLKR